MVLSAKGSRLAKFFDNPRGDDISPSAAMHGPGSNVMPPPGHQNRNGIVTPPQFDNSKNQGMPDLLALLQGAQPQGNQQPNRINNGMDPSMDLAMQRHRELALQQQQLREREARQLDPLYNQNADFYDSRGAFVANDLVPGLRPPIQRQERDLYNSDRLDERLNYAAHGRVPGVPGGYDQMMRNMSGGLPLVLILGCTREWVMRHQAWLDIWLPKFFSSNNSSNESVNVSSNSKGNLSGNSSWQCKRTHSIAEG